MRRSQIRCACGAQWDLEPTGEIQVILCSCGRNLQASITLDPSFPPNKPEAAERRPVIGKRVFVAIVAILVLGAPFLSGIFRSRHATRGDLRNEPPLPRDASILSGSTTSTGPLDSMIPTAPAVSALDQLRRIAEEPVSTSASDLPLVCAAAGMRDRPMNGFEPIRRGNAGLGELTISNGTAQDAILLLSPLGPGKPVRAVYIRSNSTATLRRISPRLYIARYALGTDWSPRLLAFCSTTTRREFAEPLAFSESPSAEGTKYSTWELTLHPVAEGKAQTRQADPAQFVLIGDSLAKRRP